jgi:hypothetical protein
MGYNGIASQIIQEGERGTDAITGCGADGTVYTILSTMGAEQIGGVQVVEVESG